MLLRTALLCAATLSVSAGVFEHEEREMAELFKKVQAGAREPDGWWLKTCAGWSALMLCGAVFGAGIDEPTARVEDVGILFGSATTTTVDYERQAVDSLCAWNFTETIPYTAIYREGIGCTLVEGVTEAELRAQDLGNLAPPPPLDPVRVHERSPVTAHLHNLNFQRGTSDRSLDVVAGPPVARRRG